MMVLHSKRISYKTKNKGIIKKSKMKKRSLKGAVVMELHLLSL